jgi:hypothetical protein
MRLLNGAPCGLLSGARRGILNGARCALAVLLALSSLACFEQPVTESMEIRFLPENAALISVKVRLADPDLFKESAPARERIESARRDLQEGSDSWTRRLESLEPEAQRSTYDRTRGSLTQVNHRVLIDDTEEIQRLFADAPIRVTVTRREEDSELSMVPEPGSRASRVQQERLKREMEDWSEGASRYLEAGHRLFTYLEENPERARACFGSVFEDVLSQSSKEDLEKASPGDLQAVDPFKKEMESLLKLFSVPKDSPYSPEELSRLVYDPFPAPLSVRVPGKILEIEGFHQEGAGLLRVPGLSLWEAFQRVGGRWLSPDPAVAYYSAARREREGLDLDDFLSRPRSSSPAPSPREVFQSLEESLRSAPIYRVRWSTANLEKLEIEDLEDLWDSPALQ